MPSGCRGSLRKSRYAIPVSSRMSPIGYPTDSEYANTLSLAEWSVGMRKK